MPESSQPDPLRTLIVRNAMAIPVLDTNGDHLTVGLISPAARPGLDQVVVLMTPDEARLIADELLAYANR